MALNSISLRSDFPFPTSPSSEPSTNPQVIATKVIATIKGKWTDPNGVTGLGEFQLYEGKLNDKTVYFLEKPNGERELLKDIQSAPLRTLWEVREKVVEMGFNWPWSPLERPKEPFTPTKAHPEPNPQNEISGTNLYQNWSVDLNAHQGLNNANVDKYQDGKFDIKDINKMNSLVLARAMKAVREDNNILAPDLKKIIIRSLESAEFIIRSKENRINNDWSADLTQNEDLKNAVDIDGNNVFDVNDIKLMNLDQINKAREAVQKNNALTKDQKDLILLSLLFAKFVRDNPISQAEVPQAEKLEGTKDNKDEATATSRKGIDFVIENMKNFQLQKPTKIKKDFNGKQIDAWIQKGTYTHPETKKDTPLSIEYSNVGTAITLSNYDGGRDLNTTFSYGAGGFGGGIAIAARLIDPENGYIYGRTWISLDLITASKPHLSEPEDYEKKRKISDFIEANKALRERFDIPQIVDEEGTDLFPEEKKH